jgi:hypothetical protein
LALSTGCRSTTEGTAFERHRSVPIWGGAAADVFEHSPQRELLYGIAGATLLAAPFDQSLSNESSEDQVVTSGNTSSGDTLALALGGAALAYGGWEWGSSGESLNFEIAAEALAATEASVYALKLVTSRQRPDNTDHESFPSGHTAFAFAGATLLANAIEDDTQGRSNHLGYLLYLPALYVAVDRVEAGKHYVTDVGVGALIGIFMADWVRAAHKPCADEDRPTIYTPGRPKLSFKLEPFADEQCRGVTLDWSF